MGAGRRLRLAAELDQSYCGVDAKELGEGGLEAIEGKGVGTITLGAGRVVVGFEEEAVNSGGDGGAGKNGDELRLTATDSVAGAGGLNAVRGVEDHRGEGAHDGQ